MFSSLPVFLLFFTHVLVFILLFLSLLCHCFKVMICMYVCYTLFNKYSVILNVTSVRLSDGCLSHSTVLSETLNITTASPICVVSFLRAKFHLTSTACRLCKVKNLILKNKEIKLTRSHEMDKEAQMHWCSINSLVSVEDYKTNLSVLSQESNRKGF